LQSELVFNLFLAEHFIHHRIQLFQNGRGCLGGRKNTDRSCKIEIFT
jgi:hypothetical protein